MARAFSAPTFDVAADITPTAGWICIEPGQAEVVAALLGPGRQYVSSPHANSIHVSHVNVGSVNIVIIGPSARRPGARPAESHLRRIIEDLPFLETIIIAGVEANRSPDSPSAGLSITRCFGGGATLETSALRRAVNVLHAEVGQDGSWLVQSSATSDPTARDSQQGLSHGFPRLHFGLDVDSLWPLLGFAAAARTLIHERLATAICVLGVQQDEDPEPLQNTILLAKELLQLTGDPLVQATPSLAGTEYVVLARLVTLPPPFPMQWFPTYGKTILLIIPSENEKKRAILQEEIAGRAPAGVKVHMITVPVDSDVGEQPYNTAGVDGAYNRICNVFYRLQSPRFVEILARESIGTIFIAAIENYIQTEDIDRPADFGIVVVHNATTNQTVISSSRGVTVAPEYVDRARRFGTDGDVNHGRVTVGKVLAARVPGLDNADWQLMLAGLSRYELLREAVAGLQIPW